MCQNQNPTPKVSAQRRAPGRSLTTSQYRPCPPPARTHAHTQTQTQTHTPCDAPAFTIRDLDYAVIGVEHSMSALCFYFDTTFAVQTEL